MGNVRTALVAWLAARQADGTLILRVEDLDEARTVAGAEASLCEVLTRLGLDWDEGPDRGGPRGPYRQSERLSLYRDSLALLQARDLVYPCACTRADVARAASAPHGDGHGGEDGPRYPGTCRALAPGEAAARARAAGRGVALRFRGDGALLRFTDAVYGPCAFPVDDFVVQRADGVPSYQLAVAVDDAAMGVTQVVRGADLLPSTARQLALLSALARPAPSYAHVPLVLAPDRSRLAKRNRPIAVAELLDAGLSPGHLLALLGSSLGLCAPDRPVEPRQLLAGFALERLPRQPWIWPAARVSTTSGP